jgi:hypothetical protein
MGVVAYSHNPSGLYHGEAAILEGACIRHPEYTCGHRYRYSIIYSVEQSVTKRTITKQRWIIILIFFLPNLLQAEPHFGRAYVGDRDFPQAWGVGIQTFHTRQDLVLERLSLNGPARFPLPQFNSSMSSSIESEAHNRMLKFDTWILPFLNLFALYGDVDGQTHVKISSSTTPLPPQLSELDFDYDGDVRGLGFVLAGGWQRWFASLTASFTETELDGEFSSSISTVSLQPRLGYRLVNGHQIWIGGYKIDTDEKHSGSVNIYFGPGIGVVPIGFDAELSQKESFNFSLGARLAISQNWEVLLEAGGGNRQTALANITYRFE